MESESLSVLAGGSADLATARVRFVRTAGKASRNSATTDITRAGVTSLRRETGFRHPDVHFTFTVTHAT